METGDCCDPTSALAAIGVLQARAVSFRHSSSGLEADTNLGVGRRSCWAVRPCNQAVLFCERRLTERHESSSRLPFNGAQLWRNHHPCRRGAITGEASKARLDKNSGRSSGISASAASTTRPETSSPKGIVRRRTNFALAAPISPDDLAVRGRRPASGEQCGPSLFTEHQNLRELRGPRYRSEGG